jgi:hypothetical protein
MSLKIERRTVSASMGWISGSPRNGEVVGLAHWQDDFLHALHVRSDHGRCGVDTRLIDRAEAEIARSGFEAVSPDQGTLSE